MDNTNYSADSSSQAPVYQAPTYDLPNGATSDAAMPEGAIPAKTSPANAAGYKSPRRKAFEKSIAGAPVGVILIIAFVFGMIFSGMVVRGGFGLGATVSTLVFFAAFTPFIIRKGKKISLSAILLALPLLAMAVSFALNASFEGRFWMIAAFILLYMVQTTALGGCTASPSLSREGFADALHTHLLSPFENMGSTFSALRGEGEKSSGKKALGKGVKVVLGLIISIPVVAVLTAIFVSADAAFAESIEKVLDYIGKLDFDFGGLVADILIGAIVCVVLLPTILTLRAGYSEKRERKEPKRWIDSTVAVTVVFASAVVYLAFVAVQFRYFFAVQLGYFFDYTFDTSLFLPDDMTWAEYARSGFFELSGIIIATFAVTALLIAFCKRGKDGKMTVPMRVALTILSLCNLVLAASAILRMRLYTIWCGLTAKRIGVLMIIAVIVLSVLAAVVKLWWEKFDLLRFVAVTALCAITVFSCMNVDALCARVNVARHIEGVRPST
ncbi:MAG: DUF4173 domain-containing protein [Clostridia bacterium]|nr:DUF4173 domain-containing protein [Clostridia bacterium]